MGLCALLLAALVTAPPAAAVIRVNEGMAGVRLGMTERQVRARLGEPSETLRHGRIRSLSYRRLDLFVAVSGRRAVTISTDGRAERTPQGVGVGSSEWRLRRYIRGLDCRSAEGVRTCALGGFDIGERNTVFVIERRRVRVVTISRVFE